MLLSNSEINELDFFKTKCDSFLSIDVWHVSYFLNDADIFVKGKSQ